MKILASKSSNIFTYRWPPQLHLLLYFFYLRHIQLYFLCRILNYFFSGVWCANLYAMPYEARFYRYQSNTMEKLITSSPKWQLWLGKGIWSSCKLFDLPHVFHVFKVALHISCIDTDFLLHNLSNRSFSS